MMNFIWVGLVVIAIVCGVFTGQIADVQQAVFDFADDAVQLVFGLIGIMAFWLGLMRVAEKCGLTQKLSHALKPIMKRLFPDVPPEHPAMASMAMEIAANMLGLGDAATPFGLKAMGDLQTLNKTKDTATDAMCMFLAISTSSVTIIPTTVLAFRSSAGSANITEVVGPMLLCTIISTATGIICAKLFSKTKMWKLENVLAKEKAEGSFVPNNYYVPWEATTKEEIAAATEKVHLAVLKASADSGSGETGEETVNEAENEA